MIGAGLAGCHTAYELANRGVRVLLIDAASQVAAGASGNHAGIVKPFVTRESGQTDRFYQQAFQFLLNQLQEHAELNHAAQFEQCGVLQLLEKTYPPNAQYSVCTPAQASAIAGLNVSSHAIFFADGGWLNPASLCRALVNHPNIQLQLNTTITGFEVRKTGWLVKQKSDHPTAGEIHCAALILANGYALNQFELTKVLPVTPARGQCSHFPLTSDNALRTVVSGKRYVIPTSDGVMVGASFERDNTSDQINVFDHEQNRAALGQLFPKLTPPTDQAQGFCAVRATSPDRLPVVGPMPDFEYYQQSYKLLKNGLPEKHFSSARYLPGLYVIGGFGSRGIVSSPYCASLLANYLCPAKLSSTAPKALQAQTDKLRLADWSQLLHPARFKIRDLRRARE